MLALPLSLIPEDVPSPPKRISRVSAEEDTCAPQPSESQPTPKESQPTTKESQPTTKESQPTAPTEEPADGCEVEVLETAVDLKRNKTLRELKDMCTELRVSNVGRKDELAMRIIEARS